MRRDISRILNPPPNPAPLPNFLVKTKHFTGCFSDEKRWMFFFFLFVHAVSLPLPPLSLPFASLSHLDWMPIVAARLKGLKHARLSCATE